jgi:ribosomal protein L11 methylase PrmA
MTPTLQGISTNWLPVWDLGANAGEFSRIFSSQGILTVAWDGDPAAVEHNFLQVAENGETHLLPLVQDFANPSPSIGWMSEERSSFFERGPADVTLALALIHHLVIGNSVPLEMVAAFFARTSHSLIIEFVDPEDPRVVQLLSTRSESHEYGQEAFEAAFQERFEILRQDPIRSSKRILYLMRRKLE